MFIFACENVGIHMSVYVLVHVCRAKSLNVSKSKNIVRILRSFKVSILITFHLECESAGVSSFFVYVCVLKGVCVHWGGVCVCMLVRVCVCVCVCVHAFYTLSFLSGGAPIFSYEKCVEEGDLFPAQACCHGVLPHDSSARNAPVNTQPKGQNIHCDTCIHIYICTSVSTRLVM